MCLRPTKDVWKASVALSKEKITHSRTEYSENNTLGILFVLYELFLLKNPNKTNKGKKPQNKQTRKIRKEKNLGTYILNTLFFFFTRECEVYKKHFLKWVVISLPFPQNQAGVAEKGMLAAILSPSTTGENLTRTNTGRFILVHF